MSESKQKSYKEHYGCGGRLIYVRLIYGTGYYCEKCKTVFKKTVRHYRKGT